VTLNTLGLNGRYGRRGEFAAITAIQAKKESTPPHPLLKKKYIKKKLLKRIIRKAR
jgi:hypothetical protein